jgi:hypothetical protein
VQRQKADISGVCKGLVRGENGNGWVGGIILYLLSHAIQLAYVNSPVFLKLKIILEN